MENKEIDNLFRDTFENAEATPSQKVWRGIEDALDQEKVIPTIKRSPFHWTYYAAAASVLVALGIVVWTMLYKEKSSNSRQEIALQQDRQSIQISRHDSSDAKQTNEQEVTIESPLETQQTGISNPLVAEAPKQASAKLSITELPKLELQGIQQVTPNNLQPLASLETAAKLPTYRVTEIEEIKPMIEPEEEMESMYASSDSDPYTKNTLVTSLLNTISENMETNSNREVRFRADEEGSIRIDILNSLVKNRNKKRR